MVLECTNDMSSFSWLLCSIVASCVLLFFRMFPPSFLRFVLFQSRPESIVCHQDIEAYVECRDTYCLSLLLAVTFEAACACL